MSTVLNEYMMMMMMDESIIAQREIG